MRRDDSVDVLKGIAIILMVAGHSGVGEAFTRFIYLFHMAVFVIAAGYCYNEKYSAGLCREFVGRRFKTLWMPYVVYMLALILLHNILTDIHFYTDLPEFLNGNYGNEWGLTYRYSLKELVIEALKGILLLGGEQLFGAAWFIRVLFYQSLLWCVIDNGLVRLCKRNLMAMRLLIAVILLMGGCAMTKFGILNFSNLPTIFTSYILFCFGFCIKKGKAVVSRNGIVTEVMGVLLGFFVLVAVFLAERNVNMSSFDDPLLYCAASLAGWCMLYHLAGLVLRSKAKLFIRVLVYLGRHTMPIVLFHFAAFKIVTLLEMVFYHLPLMRLASFPIYKGTPCWWVLYLLVGLLVPLGIAEGWRRCVGKCRFWMKE